MSTLYHSLSRAILDEAEFRDDILQLFRISFARRIGTLSPVTGRAIGRLSSRQIGRMAEAASILSCSSEVSHQRTAYDIATQLYEVYGSEYSSLASITRLVLARTGNIPSLRMVADPVDAQLPTSIATESAFQQDIHTILIRETPITLTTLQLEAMRRLSELHSVSISAPTSAGKSFLITAYLARRFSEQQQYVAVILVPTRALIRQFSQDVLGAFNRFGLPNVQIWTSAGAEPSENVRRAVFILTQERLQSVLDSWRHLPTFDLLVVDEAQKFGDDSRGILLEDTVSLYLQNPGNPFKLCS